MQYLHNQKLYDKLDTAIVLNRQEEAISILENHRGEIDVNWLDGDDNDTTLLSYALFRRQYKIIQLLLEAGADPELDSIYFSDPPLIRAIGIQIRTEIENKPLKICQMLIDAGANVNQRNSTGETPLWWASGYDNVEILKLLLDKGANVNAINSYVVTPLMRAAEYEMYDNVQILLSHGACVTLKDEQGQTALDYAQKTGNKEIIELLQNAEATKD